MRKFVIIGKLRGWAAFILFADLLDLSCLREGIVFIVDLVFRFLIYGILINLDH